MNFKQEFEKQLEDIYLGRIKEIKGDGGYINLIKIKSQFYNDILSAIKKCENSLMPKETNNVQDEQIKLIYEHIYTFFSKYLNDTGTPFYSKVKSHAGTYAPVYKDDDVSLFWKTQDLYYIKSEKLFDEMSFDINDNTYSFNVDDLKRQTANEKLAYKFIISIDDIKTEKDDDGLPHAYFPIKVISGKKDGELFDSYIDLGTKGGLSAFSKEYSKINNSYNEDELLEAIRKYQKQSEIDYFIHKNAKLFLEEQLDLYLYSSIGRDLITEFNPESIKRYQNMKVLASAIIDNIARFENELKLMWEKPKLVKNSNYIITLDKLPQELVGKIQKEAPKAQKEEWIELGFIDNKWTWKHLVEENYKTLPIDTKHLSFELKYEILASFDSLDEQIDGVLIKSDNYQALKTLQTKYQEKIDYIYIDPPYNAPVSEIIYRNGFKHSTWLTMMENRLLLSKYLLTNTGCFTCAIDENEQERLGLLLRDIFYSHSITSIAIQHNKKGTQGDFFSNTHEIAYFAIPYIFNTFPSILVPQLEWSYDYLRNWGSESERNTAKNCFYPIFIKDDEIIGFGDVCDDTYHPNKNEVLEDGIIAIYPIDGKGIERKWRYARQSIENIKELLQIVKIKEGLWDIKKAQNFLNYKTMWYDTKYIAGDYGSALLTNLGLGSKFDFPKSIYTVKDSIHIATAENTQAIILDFFAGSGTTAHAVLMQNDEDGGSRKFILVEMGDHFNNVILPRIKKIAFAKEWKNGKPNSTIGYSQFVKYYELESYDDILTHAQYKTNHTLDEALIWDEKLSKALVFNKDNSITFDFAQIGSSYQNFADNHTKYSDIAESLSNLFGADIIKIDRNKLTLKNVGELDMDHLNFADERVAHIKKLIWWESI